MWNWLNALRMQNRLTVPARWLDPGENPWGLRVLDCSQNACSMMSTTTDAEIAETYARMRNSTGEELSSAAFNPTRSIPCNLVYHHAQRIPDGPVFKSQVMEEKWDIYIYEDRLYFCRSWGGQLIYRVSLQREPPALRVHLVEASHQTNEKSSLREVDFLIKSHVLSAKALHPLPRELDRNTQKLALSSFSAYGRMGLYGTFEETIGTPYFAEQPISNRP
jgi:hypothetical protein